MFSFEFCKTFQETFIEHLWATSSRVKQHLNINSSRKLLSFLEDHIISFFLFSSHESHHLLN